MKLGLLDSVSDPAKPGGENEDRIGWNATAAFVIDGATSLGDPVLDPTRSDAVWLADAAARALRDSLRPGCTTAAAVRDFNAAARAHFLAGAGDAAIERWRHPNAGFLALRVMDGAIEIAGLADCVLFLRHADGTVTRHTGFRGSRGQEQAHARNTVARLGGLGPAGESHRDAETLERLRSSRARLNTPGGVWTLGIDPAAADHVLAETLAPDLPVTGILCTDGFADLVDNYRLCTPAELIGRAERDGFTPLVRELRRIERAVDPDGLQFPRFKRSDDASAILLRVS